MTIKVEREALLRLLNTPPSNPQLQAPISHYDEFCMVGMPGALCMDGRPTDKLVDSSFDDDSIITDSTDSLISDSEDDEERRVAFSPTLVTEEWTREYTPREEIANLFYSTEETQRFRQEYRLERRLLTELLIDPEASPADPEELSNLLTKDQSNNTRHCISRVVVLHNDKLETFFNNQESLPLLPSSKSEQYPSDDFFDNDSFWSGSITWY